MIVVIAGNAVVDIAVDDDAVEEGEEADVVVFAAEILLSEEVQFWLVGEVFYHQF